MTMSIKEKIEQLEEVINESAIDDVKTSEAIYSHITKNIIASLRNGDSEEAEETYNHPPLFVIIYTIQRFTAEPLLTRAIPRVLTLLATVDAVRMEAVRTACQIQEELRTGKRKKVGRPKALAKAANLDTAESTRYVFLNLIVFGLCRLYLRELWKISDTSTFFRFMRETFPSLYIKDKEERFEEERWKAPIHQGLTLAEREQFHAEGKMLVQLKDEWKAFDEWFSLKKDKWVQRSIQWQELKLSERTDERAYLIAFEERFAEEGDNEEVMEGLSRYIKQVKSTVDDVEDILGGRSRAGTVSR